MFQFAFTQDDQHVFARLSGDYNPLHLDPVLSRRLLFGHQVVHGLHAVLRGLDHFLKDREKPLELLTIKANFQAGIAVGKSVDYISVTGDEHRAEIRLEADRTVAACFKVDWRTLQRVQAAHIPHIPERQPEPLRCKERSLEEAAVASGDVFLFLDRKLATKLFPHLTRVLPPIQLAALLATTRLVGMECPGLHSIYAGLDLTFSSEGTTAAKLSYHVAQCNPRLALISMAVDGPGVKGRIKTFHRPKPQKQPLFSEFRGKVEPTEFAGQTALVVGGSRGLGEVAAKLLAAGGAEVLITYFRGEQDAHRVVKDIVSHGAAADCFPLNVLKPLPGLLNRVANRSKPLYLYYFATPFIFGTAKGKFTAGRFATFSEYYVTGLLQIFQAMADPSFGLQKIFYPSTIAIEHLPLDMGEYAAAKIAGEIMCDFLQKANPGLKIHKPRLPRLATDQTVGLLPVIKQDPLAVLLENLRYLRDM